jgi:hypothetical protein
MELLGELLELHQVPGDVLADRSMRAAASLETRDPFRWQGLIAGQEFAVLAREDVVGHLPEAGAWRSNSEPTRGFRCAIHVNACST